MKSKKRGQLVHKQKTTNYISIPASLRDAVGELNLSPTYKSQAFKLIGILLRESYRQHADVFQFVDMPNTYFLEVFGNRYKEWIFLMLEKGVILRSDFYSKEHHQCYRYAVNSTYYSINNIEKNILYTSIPLCSNNTREALSTVGFNDIYKINSEDATFRNHFKSCLKELTIDFEKLEAITNEKVNSLSIADFRVNEEIREKIVVLKNQYGQEYRMNAHLAILKARQENKSLIQDGTKFRIVDESEFIARKKISISTTYGDAVLNIKNGNLRAGRNATNQRLDTNITNLCSLLTDAICEQNGLVQIDLANSQFAILSSVIEPELATDDFRLFKELSGNGGLYDFVKDELGLESRKDGKNAMFEILFSSRKNNTATKAKLKTLFPSVIKWVDRFKAANGDKAFAVMLQRKESEIFIDTILRKLIKRKLFALTKHDSVIVKASDKAEALQIIQDAMNEIGMAYKLVIEDGVEKSIASQEIIEHARRLVSTGRGTMALWLVENHHEWSSEKIREVYELLTAESITL